MIFFFLRVRNPDSPFYRTALFAWLVLVGKYLFLPGGLGTIIYDILKKNNNKASQGRRSCYVSVKINTCAKSLWGNWRQLSLGGFTIFHSADYNFTQKLISSVHWSVVLQQSICTVTPFSCCFAHSCFKMEPLLCLEMILHVALEYSKNIYSSVVIFLFFFCYLFKHI